VRVRVRIRVRGKSVRGKEETVPKEGTLMDERICRWSGHGAMSNGQ
jgi:hypothetical protein